MAWQKMRADETILRHAVAIYVSEQAGSLDAAFDEALSLVIGWSAGDKAAALGRLRKMRTNDAELLEKLLNEAKEKKAKGLRYVRPVLLNSLTTPARERRLQVAGKLEELARQATQLASRLETINDGDDADSLQKEGLAILRGVGVPEDVVSQEPGWRDPKQPLSPFAAAILGEVKGPGSLLTDGLRFPARTKGEDKS